MKVSAKQRATLLRQTGPFTTRVFATHDAGAPVGVVFFDNFDGDGIPQSHHILVFGIPTLRQVAQLQRDNLSGEDFEPRDFSPTYFGTDRRRERDRRTQQAEYDLDQERRMQTRRADEDEETGSAVERVLMAYHMGEQSALHGEAEPHERYHSRPFKEGWRAARARVDAGEWIDKAPQRAARPDMRTRGE